jgi:glycerol uptake facilitator-like aquaporin
MLVLGLLGPVAALGGGMLGALLLRLLNSFPRYTMRISDDYPKHGVHWLSFPGLSSFILGLVVGFGVGALLLVGLLAADTKNSSAYVVASTTALLLSYEVSDHVALRHWTRRRDKQRAA